MDVYDARDVFTSKKEMPLYPADELKKNDLVLLESKIMHYRVKNADNKWTSQHVQMEMVVISLLSTADTGDEDVNVKSDELNGV